MTLLFLLHLLITVYVFIYLFMVDVLLVVVGCLTRCNVDVGILEIMPMEVGVSIFQNTCCHFNKKVVMRSFYRSSLRLNTCTRIIQIVKLHFNQKCILIIT
jgi:hypothetical protein